MFTAGEIFTISGFMTQHIVTKLFLSLFSENQYQNVVILSEKKGWASSGNVKYLFKMI